MEPGPFNKDIQAKSGEPLVERWVRVYVSFDVWTNSVSKAIAKDAAKRYVELELNEAKFGYDFSVDMAEIIED